MMMMVMVMMMMMSGDNDGQMVMVMVMVVSSPGDAGDCGRSVGKFLARVWGQRQPVAQPSARVRVRVLCVLYV